MYDGQHQIPCTVCVLVTCTSLHGITCPKQLSSLVVAASCLLVTEDSLVRTALGNRHGQAGRNRCSRQAHNLTGQIPSDGVNSALYSNESQTLFRADSPKTFCRIIRHFLPYWFHKFLVHFFYQWIRSLLKLKYFWCRIRGIRNSLL